MSEREKRAGAAVRSTVLALALWPALQQAHAQETQAASETEAPNETATTDEASGGLQEVVVTAQFRAESLQDTPLSITAVDARDIEARNLSNVTDVATAAPNVNMRPGGSAQGSAAQVFIRGVGQYDASFAYEPGVGMYIDDVYHGTLLGSMFELLDLERVEILRGPQGTLAGKNSIGGAVKLYSKKPTGTGSGYLDVAYGSFDRVDLKGSADFAIVPGTLSARVSGVSKQSDGYLTRLDYGCLNPGSGVSAVTTSANCELGTEGGRDLQAGRLALRWIANDDLEMNLIGTILSENSEVGATKLLDITTRTNIPATIDPRSFVTDPHSRTNYATYTNPAFTDPARYQGAPGAGAHGAISVDPRTEVLGREVSGKIDWTLSDDLTLTSISAYQRYSGAHAGDIDVTPFGLNTVNYEWEHEQITQELRLNGASLNDLVDWTVGVYYYDATSRFGGVNYNSPGLASENLYVLDDRIPSQSKSGFAHAVWHVTERLNLTTGFRYTDDQKGYYFHRLNPYNVNLPSYTSAGAIDGTSNLYEGNNSDYRVSVDYRWTNDFMTYVQFATGYKGGGVNPRPYVAEQVVPFLPETLDAYEIGFKSDLLGKRVRLNGAVFLNKYQDMIFTNQTPTPNSNLNATPVNAGDGEFRGAELEVNAYPLEQLRVDLSASYLDFQLKKLGAAGATIAGITLDSKSPYAPEWKGSASVQYEIPLGGAGSLTPRLDFSYQSSFFSAIDNDPRARVDGYSLLNGRVAWRSQDDNWELAVSGTNLTNKYYYLNKLRYPIGVVIGQPAPPREWKIGIRRSF
jgi:iron complex outermembrane receptor protein